MLNIRVTPSELRAVKRYARYLGRANVSDFIRSVVVSPAVNFDPRQTALVFEEKERSVRAS